MSYAASQLWVTGSDMNQVSREQNLSLQLKNLDAVVTPDTLITMGNNGTVRTKPREEWKKGLKYDN